MSPVRIAQMARASATSPYYVTEPVLQNPTDQLAPATVPAGWTNGRWGSWQSWSPPGWVPRQHGWKIHVSSTVADHQECLDRVSVVCESLAASFKFRASLAEFRQSNAKHADRHGAGKFVTVYPDSDIHLSELTRALAGAVGHLPGPYILTDVRYRQTPIFFRYGAIVPVQRYSELDEGSNAIVEPGTGKLIPDTRTIGFSHPPGVPVPPEVAEAIADRGASVRTELDAFASITPLQFSNAGGIYQAARRGEPEPRLLREARPLAGLDALDRDAVTRLQHEARVFADLAGSRYVQRMYRTFTAWEHHYLELGYVEGTNLQQWPVRHFPFHPDDQADQRYAARCLRLIGLVAAAVEDIHGRGWCLGDLHPGNVIVAPDEARVWLIDLEEATRIGEPRAVGMRVAEYGAPEDRDAREADWYAVTRMAMSLYVVDWVIELVAPLHWAACLDQVARRFGAASRAQIQELASRSVPAAAGPAAGALRHPLTTRVHARPTGMDGAQSATRIDRDEVVRRLVAGILASPGYGNTRDFPGEVDPEDAAAVHNVHSGRAGVLLALHRLGEPVDTVDRERLVQAARTWRDWRSAGLYTGLAGLATALFELGEPDLAVRAAGTSLRWALGANRCDLFGGLAGVVVAALRIGAEVGDDRLVADARAARRQLDARLSGPGAGYFAAPLDRRTGLYYGWCGIAVLDLVIHLTCGDQAALDRAGQLLRRDLDRCVVTRDGALAAMDRATNKSLPYLEWGSAGVLATAALLDRAGGAGGLTTEQEERLVLAASSTKYVYAHLSHGTAGIVTALGLCPWRDRVAETLEYQIRQVNQALVSLDGHLAVVGEGLIRLSSDYGTGAAGVALALAGARSGALTALPIPAADRLLAEAQRLVPSPAR